MQAAAQVGFVETEALSDAGQMPDRIDRRLHHANAAVGGDDIAVGADAARRDGGADFGHVDMSAGDRDGGPHVVTAREVIAEDLAHQVSPGIERYDLFGIAPLRVRSDVLDRRGIREIGDMIVGERPRRNGEGAIDRIAAGVASDRVAVIGVAQGRDHRPAFGRGRRPPDEMRPLRHALGGRPVCGTQRTRVHDRSLEDVSRGVHDTRY